MLVDVIELLAVLCFFAIPGIILSVKNSNRPPLQDLETMQARLNKWFLCKLSYAIVGLVLLLLITLRHEGKLSTLGLDFDRTIELVNGILLSYIMLIFILWISKLFPISSSTEKNDKPAYSELPRLACTKS